MNAFVRIQPECWGFTNLSVAPQALNKMQRPSPCQICGKLLKYRLKTSCGQFGNIAKGMLLKSENEGKQKMSNLPSDPDPKVEEEYTPTLETILKFCYVCNVIPLQVMQNQVSRLKQVIQSEIAAHAPPPSPRLRHVNLEQCQTFLQAVLDGHEKPQGLRQIGKHLGYTVRQLSYHFPKECALITPLAQEYRRQRKEERLNRVREQVRQAVVSLHAQGTYPSLHKVQAFLPTGVMIQPEASETWHAVLRELEIES
jgi:hypothetical protein